MTNQTNDEKADKELVKKWEKRFNNKFIVIGDLGEQRLNVVFPRQYVPGTSISMDEEVIPMLKDFIQKELEAARREEQRRIKTDLLAIADKGELEDLRREVESYFDKQQNNE